jgi:nitrate/TMAO reductase-like tetraheme cytochrome c subunit
MVRFDENAFDHSLTGYELTGAHKRTDCRECHRPDLIDDHELRSRETTYLGLPKECAACHEDYHKGTLSTAECAKCHTTVAFTPADKFDHSSTDFPLKGQHQETDCAACHEETTRNGEPFQVFTGLEFHNCNNCHEDVHERNLGNNCNECHSEQSFSSRSGLKRFNHNRTPFPLKGAHQQTDCAQCHDMGLSPAFIFQDKLGVAVNACNQCHEDVHEERFGTDCAVCHNERSFSAVDEDEFDHSLTDFHLKGKHQGVDCRECHAESFIEPVPHQECAACHEDYHDGAFVASKEPRREDRDCRECHSEEGFDLTLYTLETHNLSRFPLDGAHLATPCFACHLQEDQWVFRNLGETCIDCHEDVHRGFISEEYYPDQNCQSCHSTQSWEDNVFDHSQTGFELTGAHAQQACMKCHAAAEGRTDKYAGFQNTSSDCQSCHESVHHNQFAQGGATDCARCHHFENWSIEYFDHNNTKFPLEGRHAEIACQDCHKTIENDDITFIKYQFNSFECVDCHQ